MKSLHGKWYIAGREEIVWQFSESRRDLVIPGAVMSSGNLTEWQGRRLRMQAEYRYYSHARRLAVVRKNPYPFDRLHSFYKELYDVEVLDDSTLKLNPLSSRLHNR